MNSLISSLTGAHPLWPCRLCLRKPEEDNTTWSHLDRTLKIQSLEYTTTLRNIINNLLNKQINNDDGLPQNVCDGCVDAAMWCFLFRNLCEESEKQWNNLAHITNNLFKTIAGHEESEFKLTDYKEINSLVCVIKDGTCEKTILPNKMTLSSVSEYLNKDENIFKVEFDNDVLDVAFDSDDSAKEVKKRKIPENGFNKNYKYECEICDEKYTSSASLRHHLVIEHKTVYSCGVCARQFASSESLSRHFERCHNTKCKTCHNDFATVDDLEAHTLLCQNQSHKCFECDGKSLSKEQFIEHIRSRLTCNICHKQFVGVSSLRLHLRGVHKCNIPIRSYNKTAPRKNERINRNEGEYVCKYCNKLFPTKIRLEYHLCNQQNSSMVCEKCGKIFKYKQKLENHLCRQRLKDRMEDGSCYVCEHCNKQYVSKNRLECHLRNHQHSSTICDKCGRTFKTKQRFKYHLCQKERNPGKPKVRPPPKLAKFTCDLCGKKYRKKHQVKNHITLQHVFPKQFKCFVCKKGFNTVGGLNQHQVVHTKERKFKCGVCENVFVTKPALTFHERLHTGERPYSCDQCGEKFLSTSRRMSHIRKKHWGRTEECSVCSAKFFTPFALRKHEARHSNPSSKLFCGKK